MMYRESLRGGREGERVNFLNFSLSTCHAAAARASGFLRKCANRPRRRGGGARGAGLRGGRRTHSGHPAGTRPELRGFVLCALRSPVKSALIGSTNNGETVKLSSESYLPWSRYNAMYYMDIQIQP